LISLPARYKQLCSSSSAKGSWVVSSDKSEIESVRGRLDSPHADVVSIASAEAERRAKFFEDAYVDTRALLSEFRALHFPRQNLFDWEENFSELSASLSDTNVKLNATIDRLTSINQLLVDDNKKLKETIVIIKSMNKRSRNKQKRLGESIKSFRRSYGEHTAFIKGFVRLFPLRLIIYRSFLQSRKRD